MSINQRNAFSLSQLNAKLGLMDDSDYLRLLTIAAEQANAFLSNALSLIHI